MLSVILTAATVFPEMTGGTVLAVLGGGSALGVLGFAGVSLLHRWHPPASDGVLDRVSVVAELPRATWRMPLIAELARPKMTLSTRVWMSVLRGYLIVAVLLVAYKVGLLALGGS